MVIDFLLDDIRKAIAGLEDEVSGLTAESFASVDYVSSAKTIYFYNAADEEVGSIDTTDFVVDGMIDTVTLSGNVLHFVFNTDAGKQPIDVDLSSVMPDLSAYWTSAQTKDYVDSAVSGIDLSNYYTKSETDSAITLVEDHIYDVEQVTASALTELHDDITEVQEQIDTMDDVVSAALVDLNERIGEISGSSVDLSGYYTSGETDAAISAASAGKADKPLRETYPLTVSYGRLNGGRYDFVVDGDYGTGDMFQIWAPTTHGTAGEVLVSRGILSPVWSAMPAPDVDKAYVDSAITEVQGQIDTMDEVVSEALVDLNDRKVESTSVSTIWKGTQAEYDAIVTKDASTLYIIVNNS